MQLPLLHVWFVEQLVTSLSVVLFVQEELTVPGLLQVYVLYVLYTSPFLQKAEPIYPDVPQSALPEHATLPHEPLEQACPVEQVFFNLAAVLFEHFAEAVPGFEHVYVA
jgi:hypothetical protein